MEFFNIRKIFFAILISLFLISSITEGKVNYIKGEICKGIVRVKTKAKVISLTFDDGPKPEFLPQILSVLKKHNVKATFFVIGEKISSDEKAKELLQKIIEEGHIVGNHSFTHRKLIFLSEEEIKNEIESTSKLIKEITGKYPILFRPPYGSCNQFLNDYLEKNGYVMVMWTLKDIHKDSKLNSLKKFILNNIKPGSILLFHENERVVFGKDRTELLKLLDEIIPILKKRGYKFVTIPELLKVEAYK